MRLEKNLKLISIGIQNSGQKIAGRSFEFYLSDFLPSKGVVEFSVVSRGAEISDVKKLMFAVNVGMPGLVHLELDTRITKDTVEPLAACPNALWGDLKFLDPQTKLCRTFEKVGAASGLIQHKGKLFAFRNYDGAVVYVGSTGTGSSSKLVQIMQSAPAPLPMVAPSSSMISETGHYAGIAQPVFPTYERNALMGVRDIETIGNRVFYIEQMGAGSRLGMLASSGNGNIHHKVSICELGSKGWGQTFTGLAAASWSDELLPPPAGGSEFNDSTLPLTGIEQARIATLFAKGTSGIVLNISVVQVTDETNSVAVGAPRCIVSQNKQASRIVEMIRTRGIATLLSRSYFIY